MTKVHPSSARAYCGNAGKPGHRQCGLCSEHHQPRYECGCVLEVHKEGRDP